MRKIPLKLREDMEKDKFYKECCLKHQILDGKCEGKIQWHHNLIFGGLQQNEKFCILPLCDWHHRNIVRYKEICDWIMLNRASEQELEYFSKAINYRFMKNRLNEIYGNYTPL